MSCTNTPPPQNYTGAAERQAQASQQAVNQQTAANRPNQSNPYATRTWTQGPTGEWQDSSQFTGAMGDLNASLQQQAKQAMSTPFSLSGLPEMQTGEGARNQAIDSAYGQATSRLDPQWRQREEQTRTRLMQQGLQPGSQAFNEEMARMGQDRNDSYTSALNMAIGQGTTAGDSVFRNSLAGRQQGLAEALRSRGQAMSELQGMNGMLGQQDFMGAGMAQAPQYLSAAGMQDSADFGRYQFGQQQQADLIKGIMQFLGQAGGAAAGKFALCDERAKQDVERLPVEVLPGVSLARWRYRPEHGDPSRLYVGVVAQDLARVLPSAVRTRLDGLLEVHPAFSPRLA